MSVALVVPTIRPERIAEFHSRWSAALPDDGSVRWVIVEDNPSRTFDAPPGAVHVSWREIDDDLCDDAWIISRKDSAVRAYGNLVAWRLGADVAVHLDDDCLPVAGQDFVAEHRRNLFAFPRWVESVPGLRTRGLPYANRGTLAGVMASVGLWTGNPDLDAPTSLVRPHAGDYTPPEGRWLLPAGTYYPTCGMNLAVRRDALPAMFYPMMGVGRPYRRLDDIWLGIIARRIFDRLGWHMACGRPWVHHARASDPFRNLVAESAGIAANETFWTVIDSAPLTADAPAACMLQIGHHLEGQPDDYLRRLGRAIRVWVGLFGEGTPCDD